MFNRNQSIIVYCTIVAFAILYEHQPLLPLLAEQWNRSLSDTALLTTVTMIPLALAPLIYGYFLERISSRHMLISGFSLLKLDTDPRGQLMKISLPEIRKLIRKPVNREGLTAAFLLFFVSAAMMNFLPFRIFELKPDITTGAMSLVYTGYLVGAVISVFSTRIVRLFGSERRTLLTAVLVYISGAFLFMSEQIAVLYFAMLVLMAGMFSIHSVLSGFLNHLESSRKGMINGLYVSSYYSGGVLGSFLPGLLYQSHGWVAFCLLLVGLICLLGLMVWLMPAAGNE